MDLKEKVSTGAKMGLIPETLAQMFFEFYDIYHREGVKSGTSSNELDVLLDQFLHVVLEQINTPYPFEIYHTQIRKPFDYYLFGINFLRPFIDFSKSTVIGKENLEEIQKAIDSGDNVVLLSNHQVEPDPQAINLMLEKTHKKLAENMIFVAGHRVVTDPIAVPFSKGVNLLCIYSKNYIENPPDQKHAKLSHNRRTMQKMTELLTEGGKCIYVAPSGGRDRRDLNGTLNVSPFDANSIEMFRLMAKQSGRTTHFYTLALSTHDLQPPPSTIEEQLGEKRVVNFTPIHLAFGKEIDMEGCVPEGCDKSTARTKRQEFILAQVKADYLKIQ